MKKQTYISAAEWFALVGLTGNTNRYQYLRKVPGKKRDPVTGFWLVPSNARDTRHPSVGRPRVKP